MIFFRPMSEVIPKRMIEYRAAGEFSLSEFEEQYFFASQPVVLRGALSDWPALRRWGAEHLQALYPDRSLEVGCNNRAVYKRLASAAGGEVQRESETLPCPEAMRRILSSESGKSYYLQKQSIPDLFPELMPDIQIPPWIPQDLLTDINLWFGGAGNVTPLHYDFSNNFLAQVSGVKQFTLIPADYFQECYPADSANLAHLSLVDLEQPDHERFPKFKDVPCLHATIGPGDLLYMPPFWWHFVTLDEPSMSVNFWWRSHVSQCRAPAALQRLPGAFRRGVLWNALGQLDTRGFDSPLKVAEDYFQHGALAASVLIAGAALEGAAQRSGRTFDANKNAGWQTRWIDLGLDQAWKQATLDWNAALDLVDRALEGDSSGLDLGNVESFLQGVREAELS